MDHIRDRLSKKSVVMEVDGDSLFDSHKVALRLMQAEAAALQRNFSLALRLLKTTRDVSSCAILCSRPVGCIMQLACLSVCPSVHLTLRLMWGPNSKTVSIEKPKLV